MPTFRTPQPLTATQRKYLLVMEDFEAREGHPPSVSELAELMGVKHPSAIDVLKAIERRGWIAREPNQHHGIRILHRIGGVKGSRVTGPSEAVPVLGTAAAGAPIEVLADGDLMMVPREWTRGQGCYLLRVRGDSMTGDHIADGDFVLVRHQEHVEPGAIHVCWLPNVGATIKRVRDAGEAKTLVSSNRGYLPIRAPEGTIVQGRVIRVIRDLE